MKKITQIFVNTLKPAEPYTHTHTHTDKPCQVKKQIGTICLILISFFISPVFATEINNPATCDSGTLSTDTGPTNLRANYESNQLNLTWYDDDNNQLTTNTCTYGGTITMPTPPEKRGYTFKGWKVIKYKPIAYIETNGTDDVVIDTGVAGNNNNLSIVTEFIVLQRATDGKYGKIISNDASVQGNNAWILSIASFAFMYIVANTSAVLSTPIGGQELNTKYTLEWDYNGYTKNGVRYSHADRVRPGTTNNNTIKIYGGENSVRSRIYSVKIYDNGTLIRDFIPVKDENGVVCMYDEVSKQYFYNTGTGTYIAGPGL